MNLQFDAQGFAEAVRKKRGGATFRKAAQEIGTSAATLHRVERGKAFDIETFTKICSWLEIQPSAFFKEA